MAAAARSARSSVGGELVWLAEADMVKLFLFHMLTCVFAGCVGAFRINVGTKLVILDRMEKFIDS